jgi:hypothetical protein
MSTTVKITNLQSFSYDDVNKNWNGSGRVEISSPFGHCELIVHFRKSGNLEEAQRSILDQVSEWARNVEAAASTEAAKIP